MRFYLKNRGTKFDGTVDVMGWLTQICGGVYIYIYTHALHVCDLVLPHKGSA